MRTVLLVLACLTGVACSNPAPVILGFPDTGPPDATTHTKDSGTHMLTQPTSDGGGSCGSALADLAGCPCSPGETHACYTGPAGTRGVGTCMDGMQACESVGEFAAFGGCVGEVLPSSPTACGLIAPVGDAGPVAVGNPCTTGQIVAGGEVGAGNFCSGGGCASTSTSGGSVYYCDSSGVWENFPSGNCSISACEACMRANCEPTAPVDAGACTEAFNWLSQCGPDRSSYLSMLMLGCADAGSTLLDCKDVKCVNGISGDGGVCSGF